MQSKVVRRELRERLARRSPTRDDLHVAVVEQLPDALALPLVVFDDQHAPQALRELRFELLERVDQLLALDRLQRVADRAALERLLRVVGDRDHVHRDVARLRVALELIEHAEAGVVRQVDVEQDRARPIRDRRGQAVVGRMRHDALEAQLVREVAQDARRTTGRPRRRGCAAGPASGASRSSSIAPGATAITAGAAARRSAPAGGAVRAGRSGLPCTDTRPGAGVVCGLARELMPARRGCGRGRARVDERQRQREDAALAGRALHGDVAAEQAREVARDRQAEPGAAVLAVRAAVGLAERLEDDLAADARRCRCRCRARRRRRCRVAGGEHAQRDLAAFGELERVRQQVLQDLAEALRIGLDASRARPARWPCRASASSAPRPAERP